MRLRSERRQELLLKEGPLEDERQLKAAQPEDGNAVMRTK